MNASGPLMSRAISASAMAGTRRMAPSMIGAKRGQSGGSSLPLKSAGTPSSDHGVRVALVAAHAQPADLLAEVDQVVRVAHRRQVRLDALDGLGQQVLVGHGDDGHGDAGKAPDLGREHARRR